MQEQPDNNESMWNNRIFRAEDVGGGPEIENLFGVVLTIEPQTFYGLKEIKLKTMKIQQKHQ